MMDHSDDHIALAAEFALGTLDADERAQVESMMSADAEFAAMVHAWEQKLGALNQMVGSVEPRPEIWDRIRAAIGRSSVDRAPLELPQTAPPAVMSLEEAQPAASDYSNVIRLTANARRWRRIASVTSAIAAALVVMIGVGASMPDLLPDSMRPKAKTQVVEVKLPGAPQAAGQYVAVLQKEGGGPAFILTVDGATRNF